MGKKRSLESQHHTNAQLLFARRDHFQAPNISDGNAYKSNKNKLGTTCSSDSSFQRLEIHH